MEYGRCRSGRFLRRSGAANERRVPRDDDAARHRPGRRRRRARGRLRSSPAWRPGDRRRLSWYRWVTRARGIDGRIATTQAEWLAELDNLGSLGRGVLIPASDRAVEFVARERNLIPTDLYSFEGPSNAHLELMDKASLYRLAAQTEVRAPAVQRLFQSRRARCRRRARRLPFAAQAGAVTPAPRPVRNPPQHPCPRSGRPQGRRRSSA